MRPPEWHRTDVPLALLRFEQECNLNFTFCETDQNAPYKTA